jgi:hypothetical protein
VPFFVIGIITGNGVLIITTLFMLLPAIVISFVLCLLMPAAWVQYAVTGNLLTALNPINALRMAAKNPLAYIAAVIATIIVQIILSIPAVLVVTIPWTSFAGYTASAYIYAWFYKQTTVVAPVMKTGGPATAAV